MTRQRRSGDRIVVSPCILSLGEALLPSPGDTGAGPGGDAGALRNIQKALKLKPLDVLVLLHLASYWRKPSENPWPSKGRLADSLDVDPRTVQRSIQKMAGLGYVRRIARKAKAGDNLSNEYDLRGLKAAVQKHAETELDIRTKRAAEDKTRRVTPTAFALIEGGKQN